MSLTEFFSPYVNMAFLKDLDSLCFAFPFLVVACCPMLVWMIMTLPLPPPLPGRHPLPLYIVVDICQHDQPWYLLDLCTSMVSDLHSVYGRTLGALYLLFGAVPVIRFFYLFFACIICSSVIIPVLHVQHLFFGASTCSLVLTSRILCSRQIARSE